MNRPRLSRLATELLAAEPVDVRPSSIEEEARAVSAIREVLRARARRRRRMRVASGLAFAAAIALGLGYAARTRAVHPPTPVAAARSQTPAPQAPAPAEAVDVGAGAVLVRQSASVPLAPRAALVVGDRIVAPPSAPVGVVLADASRLNLDPRSEVGFASLSTTRRFRLNRGALRADVTKLAPGERFVVETTDVEVEVHGTSFRVSLGPEGSRAATACPQSDTRVEVFEGVVSVRWRGVEDRVPAGASWPPPCAEKPSPGASATTRPTTSPGTGQAVTPSVVVTASPDPHRGAHEPSSALAEQNRLFAEATTARQNGNAAAAIAAYDRLLARHPDSVLAESATVERMRVLDGVDRARARDAAASYLARYPRGFARAEAERLLERR